MRSDDRNVAIKLVKAANYTQGKKINGKIFVYFEYKEYLPMVSIHLIFHQQFL